MNKKYMVKRNAHGQAVVVSELAKSKGKLSSVAKVVGLAILGLSSSAFAETTNEITTYGQGATAQTGGTAVGVNAKADTNGTAIGQQATASNNATANGYVSAALANDTIAIGVNSGAVGDGLGKETFTHLKEIDQKITEYSKETPPVDPLKAVAPTLRPVEGSILANPFKETSGYVWSLGSDGVFEQVTFILGNVNSFDINEQIRNDASSVYKNFYEPIKDQLKFNTEEKMRAVTLDSMKALYQSFVDSKSSTVNDFTSEYVTNIQTKLAEYENQNSALYEALLTVYQTKNPNSLTETQAQLIVDNEALSVEITKLLTQKEYGEYYSKELDRVTNYSLNSFHDDRGEKPYDETVAINMYTTVPITRTVIESLKEDPDAVILATRLSNEVAISRNLEKALMARRMLLAGMREPNVTQNTDAMEELERNLATLDREINQVKMEMDLQRSINQNTIIAILNNRTVEQQRALTSNAKDNSDTRIWGEKTKSQGSVSGSNLAPVERYINMNVPTEESGLNGFYGSYNATPTPGGSGSGTGISGSGSYSSIPPLTGAAIDQATALLKNFEGFSSKAYWDVNAYRTGYGSDTITKADGTVVKVTKDTVITREDAERDLARRTQEFANRARNQVLAESWDALPANVQAALTSYAYNYGRLTKDVKQAAINAAKTGDMTGLANAVRNRQTNNGGINAKRRNQEADYILGKS